MKTNTIRHLCFATIFTSLIGIVFTFSLLIWPGLSISSIWNNQSEHRESDIRISTSNMTVSSKTSGVPSMNDFAHAWELSLREPLYDAPAKQPVKFVPPPFPYVLVGTILNPDKTRAMFTSPSGKIEFRKEGETLGNAKLIQIQPEYVELLYYDKTIRIELPNQ